MYFKHDFLVIDMKKLRLKLLQNHAFMGYLYSQMIIFYYSFFDKTIFQSYKLIINGLYLLFFNISLTFLLIFAFRQITKDVFIPKNCRKTTIYKSEFL